MKTEAEVIEAISEELRTRHGCHTAILYGSRARGDASEVSDYDVMGVRESGEVLRVARLWQGVYLDVFVYPERDLLDPNDGMLDMRLGKILFQRGDFASRFFARLEQAYQRGPKRLRADEIQAVVVWHEKALSRIRAGGIQGNLRRAELLPALLEHLFTTRGEWYRGPKAAFQWLRANKPSLFTLYEQSLVPGAPMAAIEELVRVANDEISRNAKPADTGAVESQPRPAPVLETKRLIVRTANESDIPAILRYYRENEAHLAPTSSPNPPEYYTEDYWRSSLEIKRKAREEDKYLGLFAFEKTSGELVSVFSFSQMFRGPFHACYLGYNIHHKFEGRGLMTEALEAAIGYVFGELNFHRIMANHLPDNARSAAVLRRLGFTVEGVAKDYLFINGQWRDHVLNSLTNPTWRSAF